MPAVPEVLAVPDVPVILVSKVTAVSVMPDEPAM